MKNRKKNNRILLLLIVVLTITIGFALLSTTLSINGTAGINSNTWNIHWDDTSVHETSGSVTAKTPAAVTDAEKLNIGFEVEFELPGDYYEFTVDIKNAGTIDAKISEIVADKLTDAQDVYANYTVYYNGTSTAPKADDKLAAGETKTLKVRIEFDTNIEPTDLPTEATTFDLDYQMLYVQDN